MNRVWNAALRSGLPTVVAATMLMGCASPQRGAQGSALRCASSGTALWAYEGHPAPNLVLGASPDHNLLAQEFAGRSQWPSFDAGYQVEDEAFFSTFSYDDQTFYDRYGGGYSRQSVSERTGVIVR